MSESWGVAGDVDRGFRLHALHYRLEDGLRHLLDEERHAVGLRHDGEPDPGRQHRAGEPIDHRADLLARERGQRNGGSRRTRPVHGESRRRARGDHEEHRHRGDCSTSMSNSSFVDASIQWRSSSDDDQPAGRRSADQPGYEASRVRRRWSSLLVELAPCGPMKRNESGREERQDVFRARPAGASARANVAARSSREPSRRRSSPPRAAPRPDGSAVLVVRRAVALQPERAGAPRCPRGTLCTSRDLPMPASPSGARPGHAPR